MRPLRYQGRLPRSSLRLFTIFVKPTSACYRLVGVVERPLGPRCIICQVQGAGMVAPVPGALWVALCRARRGAADGPPAGLARADVETPPSPVEAGPSSSLRVPAIRSSRLVDPGGGMVLRFLSRHWKPPMVVPPGSDLGISWDLSLSRGHQIWGAWETSACPEKPASSPVDMLLLVVCRVGGCGVR